LIDLLATAEVGAAVGELDGPHQMLFGEQGLWQRYHSTKSLRQDDITPKITGGQSQETHLQIDASPRLCSWMSAHCVWTRSTFKRIHFHQSFVRYPK
jgi:hypothetical protein